MKNNQGNNQSNNQNKRNQKAGRKHLARKPRHRNHSVLVKRTAINQSFANQIVGAKTQAKIQLQTKAHLPMVNMMNKPTDKRLFGLKGFPLRHLWQSKGGKIKEETRNIEQTEIDNNTDQVKVEIVGELAPYGKSLIPLKAIVSRKKQPTKTVQANPTKQSSNQSLLNHWSQSPRISGAVAAILLFAMLVVAIIPTSLSVKAEEYETAGLNPTMQLAKEYIYAGSRMLAVEDYGLSGSSTPTPTPTITPTPTPDTPTPTPTPVLKPDLVISNFTITPASVTEGDAVNFSVTVTNQGQGAMNGFLGVKYQIDGGCPGAGCPSHAVSSTTINPGQSVTLNGASGTWTAVVGSHTLTAQVDDVSAIDESDETNNIATLNVNVSPAPTPTPTPTPAPAVPTIASVTANADPTCLDITLNGVSGADSYNVKILNSGYTINVTSLSFPWCGLAPATYYEYQSQAVNQYGTSAWSGIVGGTTATPPAPPVPTGLQFNGGSRTDVYLQWAADTSGQVSKYKLLVDGGTVIDNIQGNAYTVSNLYPGGKYTFQVASVNAYGTQSEWSAPINGYTVSDFPCGPEPECPLGTSWSQTYCQCVESPF